MDKYESKAIEERWQRVWAEARAFSVSNEDLTDELARTHVAIPMNPLLHTTPGEGYYRTARAAEIVLRGWDNQDLASTPRLMRWLFNPGAADTSM